jgi:hypothetical protein
MAGEASEKVVPVGRYLYAVYWVVGSRDGFILHIRHTARREGEG